MRVNITYNEKGGEGGGGYYSCTVRDYVLDLLGMGNDFGSSFGVEQFRLQFSDSCKRHQRFIGILHMVDIQQAFRTATTATTTAFLLFTHTVALSIVIRHHTHHSVFISSRPKPNEKTKIGGGRK